MSNQKIYNKKSYLLKKLILSFILFLPFILIVQQIKPIIKLLPLKGSYQTTELIPLSNDKWFNNEFQESVEKYSSQELGFRSLFIRIYNQIRFSLFTKTNVQSIAVGKDNFLYDYGYILAFNGKEFYGQAPVEQTIHNMKLLQDTLNELGKKFLLVLAPSKVRTYPEFIIDSLDFNNKKETNYEYIKKFCDNQNINYIDFNPIFYKKKSYSEFLLFPQLGVHWSRLEAVRAYDTILKKFSSLSGVKLPAIKIDSIRTSNILEGPDDDAVASMNLLYYPKHQSQGYPHFTIDKSDAYLKNLLVVGDSYWWDIFLMNLPKKTMEFNEFWYYNNEIWGNNFLGKRKADSVDIKRHILQNDFVMLICTESNYSRIGFGFVERTLKELRKPISMNNTELIEYKNSILSNENWMNDIRKKSYERNISVDSMIKLDANWIFQLKGPLRKNITLEDVVKSIYNNPEWLSELKQKAKSQNKNLDSLVKENAIWYFAEVLHLSEQDKQTNYNELSVTQIKQIIKNNLDWMKEITIKAKKRGISIDSMVTLDAIWFKKENSE